MGEIRVHHADEVPPANVQSTRDRPSHAPRAVRCYNADIQALVSTELAREFCCSIRRSVIDQDNLGGPLQLRRDRRDFGKELLDVIPLVVCGYDD